MPREHAHLPFSDLPRTDQIEQLARWVMAQPGWGPDSHSWIHELAEEAVSNQTSRQVLRGCAVKLARIARDGGHELPTDEEWPRCKDSSEPGEARRVLAYVYGHRLRLDLKFKPLADMIKRATDVSGDLLDDDALLCALEAFAALGERDSRAEALLQRLTGLAGYDQWCREVQLHGLGIADHLGDQADRIIRLSDDMIRWGEGDDPDVHYWRAYANRRRDRRDEAMESIRQALTTLPADQRESHGAYQREWDAIRTAQQLSDLATAHQRRLQAQYQRLHDEQERWLRDRKEQQDKQFESERAKLDERSAELRGEIDSHSTAARQLVPDSVRGLLSLLTRFAVVLSLAVVTGILAVRQEQAWLALVFVAVLMAGGAVALSGMGPPADGVVGRFFSRSPDSLESGGGTESHEVTREEDVDDRDRDRRQRR